MLFIIIDVFIVKASNLYDDCVKSEEEHDGILRRMKVIFFGVENIMLHCITVTHNNGKGATILSSHHVILLLLGV